MVSRSSSSRERDRGRARAFAAEQHRDGPAKVARRAAGVPSRGTAASSCDAQLRVRARTALGQRLPRCDRQPERAAHRSAQRLPADTDRRCRGPTMTPVAPQASAARTIAPTLPGSCTCPSISTICGAPPSASSSVDSRRRAIATIPEGCRTGLMAARTVGGTPSTRAPALRRAPRQGGDLTVARLVDGDHSTGRCAEQRFRDRCAPSSRSSSLASAARSRRRILSARNACTIGFWRLEMRSHAARLDSERRCVASAS